MEAANLVCWSAQGKFVSEPVAVGEYYFLRESPGPIETPHFLQQFEHKGGDKSADALFNHRRGGYNYGFCMGWQV